MTNTTTRLAIRVDTSGVCTRLDLGDNESRALAVLQAAVDGNVEAVQLDEYDARPGLTAWCNDEGRLRAADVNLAATFVASQSPLGQPAYAFMGTIVFTGGVDPNGDTLGLDEPTAKHIEALANHYRIRP